MNVISRPSALDCVAIHEAFFGHSINMSHEFLKEADSS